MAKKSKLNLLGRSEARLPTAPSADILETFPNPARRDYLIRFETTDFTSLCPVTGQVDFAKITIDYVPDKLCVETKSLKFYLASFRNQCGFNEAITNRILDDFVEVCAPRQALITADFSARGGIALTVEASFPQLTPAGRSAESNKPGAAESSRGHEEVTMPKKTHLRSRRPQAHHAYRRK